MDQEEIFMLALSSVVYFAVAAGRHASIRWEGNRLWKVWFSWYPAFYYFTEIKIIFYSTSCLTFIKIFYVNLPNFLLNLSNHNCFQSVPEKLRYKLAEWFVQPYAINQQKRHKQNLFVFYYHPCGVFVSGKHSQHPWSVAWVSVSICQKLPAIWPNM